MSATTTRLHAPEERGERRLRRESAPRRRPVYGLAPAFLLVCIAQLAFGMWMNYKGFLWFDAVSRASSALTALYSTDPHLAAIGFVWMPLPTFMEMLWVTVYPLWPSVVSSGFASTFTTALAGGATAALLLGVARSFGLSRWTGWFFALVVSLNPMLFLYGSNGMSEGIAMPFFIGSVAGLTLFWKSGRRKYLMLSGIALALAFGCVYQGVHYGAFLFAALVIGVLWKGEGDRQDGVWAPEGRWRALQSLSLIFLVPSFYLAFIWVAANWMILGEPLYFLNSTYSNAGTVSTASSDASVAQGLTGDLPGSLAFVATHTAPFAIPGIFLFAVRALDGRFFRINTLSLFILLFGMTFAFNVPFVYGSTSFGWLRYFMYPLFVAAGWGLYEVYMSRGRRRAMALVVAGWLVAVPVIFLALTNNDYGRQENPQVRSIVNGRDADQTVFANLIGEAPPVPEYLDDEIFPQGEKVALDSFAGWPIAAQVDPEAFGKYLELSTNRDFRNVLAKPAEHDVKYFLVPDPERVPNDVIIQKYPKMWKGNDPAFERVESFAAAGERQEWRLYEFVPPGSKEFRENVREINGRQDSR